MNRLKGTVMGAVATIAAMGTLALTAAGASASNVPPYVKTGGPGGYQFASNYTAGGSTPFVVSNSPLQFQDASQALGADRTNRVALNIGPASNGYASSAIVVPLGRLTNLFNKAGKFSPPDIVGDGDLAYNLYFDTNNDGTYFAWSPKSDPYTYSSMNGDNAACMGAINNDSDNADFSCFSGEATTVSGISGQMTMEDVLAKYKAAGLNPDVWAWIGEQNTDPQTTDGATAYVQSIDGTALVAYAGERHVATGTQSLLQVAKGRSTTVWHLEAVTRAAPLTQANRQAFNAYVNKGIATKMPKGLVYYTSN